MKLPSLKQALRATVLACAAVGFAASAQTKWDLPTGYPAANFHTENLAQMAAEIEKASNGHLKITLHPAGSLFPANNIKRAVRAGQAQAGEVIMSILANENQLWGLDSVPFLATSYKDADKLWKASRPFVERNLDKEGLKLLAAVPWPPQGLFSKNPINSIADMKGLKWRAYNPATSKIAELVGAQPVTVQAADLAQALATGTINAMMTSSATGVDTKVWESLKYYYEVDAWLPKNMLIVNKKAFEALDKATQDVVVKAAAEAEKRGWQTSEQKTRTYVETLAKNGMVVAKPSAQFKAELAKKVGDIMTDDWRIATGAEGDQILDAFRK